MSNVQSPAVAASAVGQGGWPRWSAKACAAGANGLRCVQLWWLATRGEETGMETIAPEFAAALNTLLEGERASVEMEVGLASGATEYQEREALTAMGIDDLDACCALHEYLERHETPVSWRIHAAVYAVLNEVRYDDRLRAFAAHQQATGNHADELVKADEPRDDLRDILSSVRDAHVRHMLWAEQRADEFAATRLLDFRTPAGRALLRRPVGAGIGDEIASETPSEPQEGYGGEPPPYPPNGGPVGRLRSRSYGPPDAAAGRSRDDGDDQDPDDTQPESAQE
jgi:hypothetical protein